MPTPVGKERLSKGVLAEHQRDRVLAAAAGVFAARGYQATTVDDLVAAARIGVGSFYALFGGKEDCFLQLYDRVVAEARERVSSALEEETLWTDRAVAALRALLELVAAEPERARVAIVEANTAGLEARRRYAATTADLAAALREGRAAEPLEQPPASFEDAAVAGIAWVLHQRLTTGEPVVVEDLLPEVESFLIAPYEIA